MMSSSAIIYLYICIIYVAVYSFLSICTGWSVSTCSIDLTKAATIQTRQYHPHLLRYGLLVMSRDRNMFRTTKASILTKPIFSHIHWSTVVYIHTYKLPYIEIYVHIILAWESWRLLQRFLFFLLMLPFLVLAGPHWIRIGDLLAHPLLWVHISHSASWAPVSTQTTEGLQQRRGKFITRRWRR